MIAHTYEEGVRHTISFQEFKILCWFTLLHRNRMYHTYCSRIVSWSYYRAIWLKLWSDFCIVLLFSLYLSSFFLQSDCTVVIHFGGWWWYSKLAFSFPDQAQQACFAIWILFLFEFFLAPLIWFKMFFSLDFLVSIKMYYHGPFLVLV